MSGCFVRSSVTGETIPVSWVIEDFSLLVSRGYYEGPEFQDRQSGSKWKFVVYASGGDRYMDFFDVRLLRESFEGKAQFVKVKFSVFVMGTGSGWASKESQLCFSGSYATRKVLFVSRCHPLNKVVSNVSFEETPYRLNKKRLLPSDTLTVKGEIVIYEENVTSFTSSTWLGVQAEPRVHLCCQSFRGIHQTLLLDVPFEEYLYCLNKKRLLPNDTLTAKGEIVDICEENQATFETAVELESEMSRTRSDSLPSTLFEADNESETIKRDLKGSEDGAVYILIFPVLFYIIYISVLVSYAQLLQTQESPST